MRNIDLKRFGLLQGVRLCGIAQTVNLRNFNIRLDKLCTGIEIRFVHAVEWSTAREAKR